MQQEVLFHSSQSYLVGIHHAESFSVAGQWSSVQPQRIGGEKSPVFLRWVLTLAKIFASIARSV